MVTQMKHLFFFFFHIMQHKFSIMVHTLHHAQYLTIFSVLHNFNHLGLVSIITYKCMHLIIHFNPGAIWLFLHTFGVQDSYIDAYCQQQLRCLIAAHNLQQFQAPIREPL
jgi:hypothetical protein